MTNANNASPKSKAPAQAASMPNMGDMNMLQSNALTTALAMGSETAQFFAARMQQDMATQKALLACKTFEDLQKVQTDFYKTAVEDYRSATERMMTILMSGVSANSTSTKRRYDDVPL